MLKFNTPLISVLVALALLMGIASSGVIASDEVFAFPDSNIKAMAIPVEGNGPSNPGYPIYEIWTSDNLETWEEELYFYTGGLIMWCADFEHGGGNLRMDVGLFPDTGGQKIFGYDFGYLDPGEWWIGLYMPAIPNVPSMYVNWGVRITTPAGTFTHGLPLGVHWFAVNISGGFFENFDDGVADNWVNDGSGTWSVPVPPGVYRMTGSRPSGNLVRYSYYQENFSDFTYEVDIQRTQGDLYSSHGIIFRGDGTYNNCYVFHISGDGQYLIFKIVGGSYTYLIPAWTYDDSIRPGLNVWNTLKVVCNGSTLEFYCNGSHLVTLSDSQFSSGKVGVKAYDVDYDSNIKEFDNAQLNLSATVSTKAKKAVAIPASSEESEQHSQ